MNLYNKLGMCSKWRFLLAKGNTKKKLLERQVETLEKLNPVPPLRVTQRHSPNTSRARCKLEASGTNQLSSVEKLQK